MDVFQVVMNFMERYYGSRLDKYVKEITKQDKYEVNQSTGVSVYKGPKHEYTFSKANTTISTDDVTITFHGGLKVADNDDNNLLADKDNTIKLLSDAIKWKNGKDDKHKDMMFGNYKISSNIVHDTFKAKKELLMEAIKEVVK